MSALECHRNAFAVFAVTWNGEGRVDASDRVDVGVAGIAQAKRYLNRAKSAQSIYTSHTSELERAAVPLLAELRLRREAPLAPLQASVGAAASQT